MLARLFRSVRRRRSRVDEIDTRVETAVVARAISIRSSLFETAFTDVDHRLLRVLLRARPTSEANRVASAIELVEALRSIESTTPNRALFPTHLSPSMHLFVALALRELDSLIDSMTYDELLQAFGGTYHWMIAFFSPPPPLSLTHSLNHHHHTDRQSDAGLREEDIATIPIHALTPGEAKTWGVEGTACAVCLEQFVEQQSIRTLPGCDHTFHAECIGLWLKKKGDCPVCRSKVGGGGSRGGGSGSSTHPRRSPTALLVRRSLSRQSQGNITTPPSVVS